MANCAHSRPMMTVSRSFSRINARNISSSSDNYGKHSKFLGLSRAFSRLKAIFHDVNKSSHFFKKFTPSSYWFCNCFFRQSAICLQKVTPGYYYVALYYSRFFYNSIKPPNNFLAALSPFILKAATFDNDSDDENDNLIADELMASHSKDLDYIKSLTLNTLTCKSCQKRHLIDQQVQGVDYCQCKDRKSSVYGVKGDNDEAWTPFLERKDILVFRQEHPEMPGMYVYKMYGKFDDITANEFVEVQTDLSEFRLSWDASTAQCHSIGATKYDEKDRRNLSQMFYWEVNWPRFFSNRDYVASRRTKVFTDEAGNDDVIVIFSKSSEHSNYPKKSKCFRIENYVSVMTVKPFNSGDQPGLEFSLTAFENPGVSLPTSITTWVAIRGMPEFMTNLRLACLERRKWMKNNNSNKIQTSSSGSGQKISSAGSEPSYLETPKHYRSDNSNANYA